MKRQFVSRSCGSGFINLDSMKSEVSLIEQHFQGNICQNGTCEKVNKNFTNSNLKTPAEMFMYLVSCSEMLKPWFKFYEDLFQNNAPDKIVLTINKVLKSTKAKDKMDLNGIAAAISRKLESLISIAQENQNVTNASLDKITKFKGEKKIFLNHN